MDNNKLVQRAMAAGGRQSDNVLDTENSLDDYAEQMSQTDDPEGSESGGDVQALDTALKQFGPDVVLSAPAETVMKMLKRDVTPQEAAYYDNLQPQQKQDLLYEIAGSDGLGSISSYMGKDATGGKVLQDMGEETYPDVEQKEMSDPNISGQGGPSDAMMKIMKLMGM